MSRGKSAYVPGKIHTGGHMGGRIRGPKRPEFQPPRPMVEPKYNNNRIEMQNVPNNRELVNNPNNRFGSVNTDNMFDKFGGNPTDQNSNGNDTNRSRSRKRRRNGNGGNSNFVEGGMFDSRNGRGGGISYLRNKGNHSQRSIFFDNSSSSTVSLESRPAHMFPDPYRIPELDEPKVFLKGLQFNLFNNIVEGDFDLPQEYERESLFKSMLMDIRKTFTSPQYQGLTTIKLYNYFRAVSQAVIEYYEIDSIMANDTYAYNDINKGIRLLLDDASSQTSLLETQFKLRRAIQGSFLPPKVFELIRWMSQWYTFNEGGDSRATCFKFSLGLGLRRYDDSATPAINNRPAYTSAEYPKYVDRLIRDLFTEQEEPGIQTAIAKTFPSWAILDLPLSCNRPVYDQRAVDIWLNTPAILKSTSETRVHPVDSNTLELATMGESGFDQIVPASITSRAATTPNRSISHLDAIFSPTYLFAQWRTDTLEWNTNFEQISILYTPPVTYYLTNVAAMYVDGAVKFKHLNKSTMMSTPDTWKLGYENDYLQTKQFNCEVLRLKPLSEEQKQIEVSEFVTRLLTG